MSLLKLAIIGDGKMGRAVRELAPEAGFTVVAFLGEQDVSNDGPKKEQLAGADVAIEFTVPFAAATNVAACARAGVPVVCGTTGWDADRPGAETAVRQWSGAMLWAPNFSIGVHLFARTVQRAAKEFARAHGEFAAQFIETHHIAKKDAPSGTAKLLADRARPALGDVPITSVRVGHAPGTHELILDGRFEQVRLIHEARDRRVFAAGALTAAKWLAGKKGVFTIDDIFGAR